MKPRVIVRAVFAWNAVLGGRFIAIYLSERAHLADSLIGSILAAQVGITSLLSGYCGKFADDWERNNPRHGRVQVIRIGILMGLILFMIEIMGNRLYLGLNTDENALIFFWLNLFLRIGYAFAVALTQPVLDGLILAHLKRQEHTCTGHNVIDSQEYGKERVHGKRTFLR